MFYSNTLVNFPDIYGIKKLVGGFTFSLGLILVVIAGAELFTGNNLIVIAAFSRIISFRQLLRNWFYVYIGNCIGCILTVAIYFLTNLAQENPKLGALAVSIAYSKTTFSALSLFFRAVLCNALVCLAVWLCLSARTNTDKILSIIFPITAFVALGFEHCIANMYFIPFGYVMQHVAGISPEGIGIITLTGMFKNIIVTTAGNIIGGSCLVGIVYWFIYIRSIRKAAASQKE
jgi:formate/nitrite transporter